MSYIFKNLFPSLFPLLTIKPLTIKTNYKKIIIKTVSQEKKTSKVKN
jgi:hypothetical protein